MTESAVAQTAAPAAVTSQFNRPKKKKAAPQNKPAAPPLGEQILKIVTACSDGKGMSLAAIKKALGSSGVDVEKLRTQIKQSIKRIVNKGSLVQSKGQGASGSFKISKKENPGKVGKRVKKPADKKSLVKKAAYKKYLLKKTADKKSLVKKTADKKSLVKKPAGKKSLVKKPAAKKVTTKKVTAKKTSSKKAATPNIALKNVQTWKSKAKPKAAKAQKAGSGGK